MGKDRQASVSALGSASASASVSALGSVQVLRLPDLYLAGNPLDLVPDLMDPYLHLADCQYLGKGMDPDLLPRDHHL
ncbi:MAG: hypothetical protein GOVbin152_5 [Prokaryotic dsDNA virus sp.]|nr:MAG: hypothetical protein GOVbin152_5 [Prokaryotic dsDNA virus sp.]